MPYRGGVDFEDEGRVRIEHAAKNGLLFRMLKKLHLAKTDKDASVWAFVILAIVLFFGIRMFINREKTIYLNKDGLSITHEELIEYNKIQPFDYESEIKRSQ